MNGGLNVNEPRDLWVEIPILATWRNLETIMLREKNQT